MTTKGAPVTREVAGMGSALEVKRLRIQIQVKHLCGTRTLLEAEMVDSLSVFFLSVYLAESNSIIAIKHQRRMRRGAERRSKERGE